MGNQQFKQQIHDLDVTVRVGKSGLEAVIPEVDNQLTDRDLVKVKFLRSARGGTNAEELAAELAEEVSAEVVDVRGHTAVVHS